MADDETPTNIIMIGVALSTVALMFIGVAWLGMKIL